MSALYFRIGTSEATLIPLFARGLPPPNVVVFSDHTARQPQGGGGEGRHGYNNGQLGWTGNNILSAEQANALRELIETAEDSSGQGNGTIWLTVPKTTAEAPGEDWLDISGIAIMPQWEPVENGRGIAYENVVLRLNDFTIQNEPSLVIPGASDKSVGVGDSLSLSESVTVSVV